MRAVLLATTLLAGCDAPPGLILEVGVEGTSIARVELIVGQACDDCPATMGAPLVAPREATIYADRHETAWLVDVDGSFAGFELDVDGLEDQTIPLLVIAGFDSANQPVAAKAFHDVVVPAHEPLYWRVILDPIAPIDDTKQPDGTERITLWRHPDQHEPSCVMVEQWTSGAPATSAIVPPADPDCDRVAPSAECAPNSPNATGLAPTIESSSCMLEAMTSTGFVCVAGGTPCDETRPAANTCERVPEDYCLPSALCACANDSSCLFDALLDGTVDGTVTAFVCHVPVTETGNLCPVPATIPLNATGLLSPGTTCKSLLFRDPYPSGLGDTYDLSSFNSAQVKLTNFRIPCAADLMWSGEVGNPPGLDIGVVMLDLALDNGRHMLVPAHIETVVDCTELFECKLIPAVTGDSLLTCGQPL